MSHSVPFTVPFVVCVCGFFFAQGCQRHAESDTENSLVADFHYEENWPGASCGWHLKNGPGGVDAEGAWALGVLGKGVTIAHIDTGLLYHPALEGAHIDWERAENYFDPNRTGGERKVTDNPPDGLKTWMHGTCTASVIVGKPFVDRNGNSVRGVAPEAEIIPYRVHDSAVLLTQSNPLRMLFDINPAPAQTLSKAIEQAIADKAHVISISMGTKELPAGFARVADAVAKARRAGLIPIAAAGHSTFGYLTFPGKFRDVIGVAASTPPDPRHGNVPTAWERTSGGRSVDVAAPGIMTCHGFIAREAVTSSTALDDRQATAGLEYLAGVGPGTSFSTAVMSGVAALWVSKHGYENLVKKYANGEDRSGIFDAFYTVVKKYGVTVPQGWNTGKFGAGIINAKKVVEAPLPEPSEFIQVE